MATLKGLAGLEAVLRDLSEKAVPAAVRRASKQVAEAAIVRAVTRVATEQGLPRDTVKKRVRLYVPRGATAAFSKITVYRPDMPVINRGRVQLQLGARHAGRKGWRGSVLTAGGRRYPGTFLVYIHRFQHWQIMQRTSAAMASGGRFPIDVTREEMATVLTQAFEQEKAAILNALPDAVNREMVTQLRREMRK